MFSRRLLQFFLASVQRLFTTVVLGYVTCTLESLPAHIPSNARSKKSVPCQKMKFNCKSSFYQCKLHSPSLCGRHFRHEEARRRASLSNPRITCSCRLPPHLHLPPRDRISTDHKIAAIFMWCYSALVGFGGSRGHAPQEAGEWGRQPPTRNNM